MHPPLPINVKYDWSANVPLEKIKFSCKYGQRKEKEKEEAFKI